MSEPITFRAGTPDDLAQIEEMTRTIWGGDDYLPQVWQAWVGAPNSHLRVGVIGDEIVASGRINEISPGYWWLEGLRVHPAHQGKGYATPLHNHLVNLALAQPGVRHIALSTDWDNEKVAHLAQSSGMRLVAQHRYLKGDPLPVGEEEVIRDEGMSPDALFARMRSSAWLQHSEQYLFRGWAAYPVTRDWVAQMMETEIVLRCGDAVALAGGNSREMQAWLHWFGGGSDAEQIKVIRHARFLIPKIMAYPDALRGFIAPLEPLRQVAVAAGMGDGFGEEGFHLKHFVRDL